MDFHQIETAIRNAWIEEEPHFYEETTPVRKFQCVYSSILGEHLDPSGASRNLNYLQYSYPVLQDFPLINLGAGLYTIGSGNTEMNNFWAPSIIAVDPENINADIEIGPIRLVRSDIGDFYREFQGVWNVFISRLDSFVFWYHFELSLDERDERNTYLQNCCTQILHHLPDNGIIILRGSDIFEVLLDEQKYLEKKIHSLNPRTIVYQRSIPKKPILN